MTEKVKNAINLLFPKNTSKAELLGDKIAEVFFNKDDGAIYFDHESNLFTFIIKADIRGEAIQLKYDQLLADLIMFVSVIEKMIKDNMLYLIPQPLTTPLFFSEKKFIRKKQFPHILNISDDLSLVKYPDLEKITINKDEEVLYCSYKFDNHLYDKFKSILFSYYFPSIEYHVYVERNFMSAELYEAAEANKIGKKSFWLAIGVAVLSPFATLFLANQCGYTTINEKQHEELIESIKESKNNYENDFDQSNNISRAQR